MEEDALKFAGKAHKDQLRKYHQEPFIEHPKRVAELVRSVPHNADMICAAYLHDVVEDTPVSIQEIEMSFSKKVAHLVHELTDEFTNEKYPHLNRRVRKKKEVVRQSGISQQAKTIKLADVIDNTRDIVKNNKNFAGRYVPEMDALVQVLEGGDPELLKMARKEVESGKLELERHWKESRS